MTFEPLTFGSTKEVARAIKEQVPQCPNIVSSYTELVFMNDGTILKRRVVKFAKKDDEYEGKVQVYKWRVKRKAMSYPFISCSDFIEGSKSRGFRVEVQPE